MASVPEPDFASDPDEGLSLRQLSDAFAKALGDQVPPGSVAAPLPAEHSGAQEQATGAPCAAQPETRPTPTQSSDVVDAAAEPPARANDDDPCQITPTSILEALLFVGHPNNEPLSSQRAAELMRGVSPEEIASLVETLNRRYQMRGCPYHIVSEGAGYRMALRPELTAVRNRFYGRVREARLSQAAIDVLAIVAYRQPITAEEVNQLRGRQCNHLLAQLVHRRLLCVERDSSSPRVARYRTTDRFLNVFGLESLNDLPRSDDVDGQ